MTQPESRLSREIQKMWKAKGAWCFKVWGNDMTPAGIPDIVGVYRGRFIACETKMPGNKLSAIQEYRIQRIRMAGGYVVVAYTVDQALEMLKHLELHSLAPADAALNFLLDNTYGRNAGVK